MKRNYSKGLLATLAFLGCGVAQQAWADKVVTSTAEHPLWFRILAERGNRYLTDNGTGAKFTGTTSTSPTDNMLWRFENNGDGTFSIVSKSGNYIDPAHVEVLTNAAKDKAFVAVTTHPSSGWTATEIANKADYYIVNSGTTQLHQSNLSGNAIISYGGGSTTNDEGCRFTFTDITRATITSDSKKTAYDELASYNVGNQPGAYSYEAYNAYLQVILSSTSTDAEVTAAKTTFLASKINTVQAGKTYYIISGPSVPYCQGKYVYCNESEGWPLWGNKQLSSAYGWTFVDAGEGKFYLQNYKTKEYIEPTTEGYGQNGTRTSKTAKTKYTVTSLGKGAFNIIPEGKNPLHAQQDNSCLVTWAGGLNTASAWHLQEVPEADKNTPALFGATAYPGTQTYAPGQQGQVLIKFVANATIGWTSDAFTANSVTLDLGATNAADLENIQVFTSKNDDFIINGKRNATLVGKTETVTSNTVKVDFTAGVPVTATTTFYVTADIKSDATVGSKFDVAITGLTYNTDKTATITSGNPEGQGVIYKVQSAPFQPYDLGSHYWRIPAMVVLHHQQGENASKNGRVVTMADNRFNHNGDLPNHIDVYERHSDDNGATWSTHKMVVGTDADHALVGGGHGFGDVSLVECASGKIVAIMVGGPGYFQSTPSNPIVPTIITSTDGGDTWSAPRTLTDELYKTTYKEGAVQGSFAGSGRGLMLQRQKDEQLNGRIMFAMSHRFGKNNVQEYIIYSDDEGNTWKFSTQSAYSGGDESKLVELADGTVMISVRQGGQRGYNKSTDGGVTWGTQAKWADISGCACNADILYVNDRVLLHSYPNNGSRKNLTIKASFDDGKSWSSPYVVCAPGASYSTMDVTKDGDIAIFYEDNACSTGFVLNYVVLPTSFIYEGTPSLKAFKAVQASAQVILDKGAGYETAETAKAGEFSKASVDALKALLPTAEELAKLSDDELDALRPQVEAAIATALSTICIVDGQSNETTYTISTFENIKGTAPKYIEKDATAVDNTTYEWRLVPSTTTIGQVYIQGKDESNYLTRSGNALAVATTAQPWNIVKGDGQYWHFKSTVNNSTYLVVNLTNGTFNYWKETAGNATWSTKFVLNAVGTITAIDGVNVVTPAEPTRYYDLQGRRVMNPTKGIFITNTGRKVIK
uniref:sialidase family protein n=1 Tax=Alloprevotella sp. TaxID=1872471 RepID=UPI003FEDB374